MLSPDASVTTEIDRRLELAGVGRDRRPASVAPDGSGTARELGRRVHRLVRFGPKAAGGRVASTGLAYR